MRLAYLIRDVIPAITVLLYMLRNRIYYDLKPFVPRAWRRAVRRKLAARQRAKARGTWPIMPGSERPPEGWLGWPDGKKFAVILTHDIEGKLGLERCRSLMELEMEMGFRSSFNFIPEGSYRVLAPLRHDMVQNGFEIGVHDLAHDGRLFRSESRFRRCAIEINRYLKEWNAVGFRSAFMLHNLDWLHRLDIEYDLSTFDTDPFEPQPEGRHTIFPFWVPAPAARQSEVRSQRSLGGGRQSGGLSTDEALNSELPTINDSRSGYVELPYSLAQDSTLFLLLRETSIEIWKKKVDWIAHHGGMVLLNTHPDYMAFTNGQAERWEYPASMYRQLLEYVAGRYSGEFWHVLPRQAADLIRRRVLTKSFSGERAPVTKRLRQKRAKLWIDLDNTPHVPFFEPIVEELKTRGFPLLITARDAFQVCELAREKQLGCIKIGRHHGKHRLIKGAGLVYRALQLAPTVLREKPILAISHGARSQLLVSNWLRIPTLLMEDYEYCEFPPMMRPSWVLMPDVIPDASLEMPKNRIRKYQGTKEDVYAWKLRPDFSALKDLGLEQSDLIATVRPPATEAHYHNPESELLFERFMERVSTVEGARVVLLPRNRKQGDFIRARWPHWFIDDRTIIPDKALDGLNLIFNSDLVVSGGGTMNREAAALGIPVYSIFRGKIGAVDQNLNAEGRLVLIKSAGDVEDKIRLVKRQRKNVAEVTSTKTLHHIVDQIEEIAERYNGSL